MDYEKLAETCFYKANVLIMNGSSQGMDVFDLTELLIKMEMEKLEKQKISDEAIKYKDEIVSIEPVGELETVDISVTGDELFYCNGILTKNSLGVAHTADCIFALISTEELQSLNQIMIKQLKNRWSDISMNRRFVVGIDKSRMKLYNVENTAQLEIPQRKKNDKSSFKKESDNSSDEGSNWNFSGNKKRLFSVEGLK